MEDSVVRVSRYLDRIGAPSSSPKNGLLLLAFSRALRRLAAKSRRLEPAGGALELSSRAVDQLWSRQVDARLDLENIVRKLSERNSVVLALRAAGYTWEEVAQALGTSVATVRNSFWREVRELRRKFQVDEKQRDRIDHLSLPRTFKTSSFRRVLTQPQERQHRRSILGCDTQIVFRLKLLRRRTVFLFHLGFVLRLFFLGFPHG